ncbi:MAG TPA: hypothetical protein VI339_05340, partial [Steroidobacteraceae bacterium]|nr:hypothetical protein [Steroidobacteraceae bacterium]
YHRPAKEEVRGTAGGDRRGSLERLPKAAGMRWIPISPLAAHDSGLELFVTDGQLAAALMRRGHQISCEYSVRVRGDLDESRVAGIMAAANAQATTAGRLTLVEPAGGEGSNQWVRLACIGLRPRDLKGIFERGGLEVNRVLRTRVGPIAMDRALARGRSRPMSDVELDALREIGAGHEPR